MKSTLVELLLVLRTLTTEPIPEEFPVVLIVPREAMPCPCEAAYDKGQLYIRNDINWTDPRWLSIVLHELEHHRQFARRGEARDCAEWMTREQEALAVQRQYLEDTQSAWRPVMAASCR
ncbi:MAG: hypothetical protein HY067_05805 [Betaproteobacteria bacterium]|nr:hypothetical protein [Betaproteobacteria bacterium]